MKKCPFCAEEIQDDAVKCRFCGEFLKKKKKWLNCLLGCLIAFVVSFFLFILFIYLSFQMLRFFAFNLLYPQPGPQPHFSPFVCPDIAGMLNALTEGFKAMWERLRDFFNTGTGGYRQVKF